jgi:hypothetical protein
MLPVNCSFALQDFRPPQTKFEELRAWLMIQWRECLKLVTIDFVVNVDNGHARNWEPLFLLQFLEYLRSYMYVC